MKVEKIRQKVPMKYWSLPKSTSYQKRFKDKLKNKEYILSKKMDGALYRYSKSEKDVVLQSRTVSKVTGQLVEKQDNVPSIMAALDKLPENTMVLGEICFLDDKNKTSKNIVSIMGCLPKKAIRRQEDNPVQFYIFDVLMYDGFETYKMPYEKRIKFLNKLRDFEFGSHISIADIYYDDIEDKVSSFLEQGYEGGVLMKKDASYQFGKRPAWTAIKIKQELAETIDLVVMDYSDPVEDYTGKYPRTWGYWKNHATEELVEGNFYDEGSHKPVTENYFFGKVGGLVLGAYLNGELVQVCKVANLTDALRDEITENKEKFLGKVAKVQAMSVDQELRSLRHPVFKGFHADKNPEECLYEEIW